MDFQTELKNHILNSGASDTGFAEINDAGFGALKFAVSIVVRLSEAIVDEIGEEPTPSYFHHYRTVNAYIDEILLKTGQLLEKNGYRYLPIAASQTVNLDGWNYRGRYSHKKAACLAGLGTVGKNSMFLHKTWGAGVRLGTLFTDCPLETKAAVPENVCGSCSLCVDACPAGAITGRQWEPGMEREELFLPEKCSEYMKTALRHIGRGAVCGVCMAVCPYTKQANAE